MANNTIITEDSSQNLPQNTTPNPSNEFTFYPNILRDYASYTYNITLQATTNENYNAMLTSQTYTPGYWTTIIQSGGVGLQRATRPASPSEASGTTQFFPLDLYINNLSFQTIVGQTQFTRGSNVCEITFDVIEPFGLSFIENLYDFCHSPDGLNEENYIQIPYLLIIKFIGYLDDGTEEIVNAATKYIPISIIDVSINLDAGGAKYSFSAIPFNELAFTDKYGTLNQTISLAGQKLSDFSTALSNVINAEQLDLVKKNIYQYPDTYNITFLPQSSSELNGANINIGESKMASPNEIATKDTEMLPPASSNDQTINISEIASNLLSYQILSSTQTTGQDITVGNSTVTFNSGSAILDCLNNLIISSKYVTQQIIDFNQKIISAQAVINSQTNATNKQSSEKEAIASLQYPLQWYKVVSQITLGNYDNLRKTYQKTLNITVKPYLINNSKSFNAPGSTPSLRVVKDYEYIFTGNNQEITKFDLSFNTAYQQYRQSNAETKNLGTGGQAPIVSVPATVIKVTPISNSLSDAKSTTAVPNSDKNLVGTGQTDPNRSTATDVASTIYSSAELLTISIDIIGDPDYIKQDEIFLIPGSQLEPYQTNTPLDNTTVNSQVSGILFDSGEIYFRLTFRTPQDYDLLTGLATAPSSHRNLFNGFYSVNTVTNKFNDGIFSQTIDAIKFNNDRQIVAVSAASNNVVTNSSTNALVIQDAEAISNGQ